MTAVRDPPFISPTPSRASRREEPSPLVRLRHDQEGEAASSRHTTTSALRFTVGRAFTSDYALRFRKDEALT